MLRYGSTSNNGLLFRGFDVCELPDHHILKVNLIFNIKRLKYKYCIYSTIGSSTAYNNYLYDIDCL